jgi:hypothetical protein
MVADFSVLLRDVEINPRMRIDHFDARELALKLDCFAKVVLVPAVVSEYKLRQEKCDEECRDPRHSVYPPRFEQYTTSRWKRAMV